MTFDSLGQKEGDTLHRCKYHLQLCLVAPFLVQPKVVEITISPFMVAQALAPQCQLVQLGTTSTSYKVTSYYI